MKRRWMRVLARGLGALVILAVVAAGVGLYLAERRMHRHVDVQVRPVALRGDAAAVERGRYLYASRGCADCHGASGAGRVFVDEAGLRLAGPGITGGAGSVTAAYASADWVRSIRHGVTRRDGR